ncbi:MAG: hypothetical protein PHH14_02640 [Candidatus Margulisbacteria bacterium]|nr:hypothetical protein [Candidatus Margulisiibacteriota bacterium]
MLTLLTRLLAILYISFISLFALDAWGSALGFIMHLIPSFILIACLVVAWKRAVLGGTLFVAIGLIFTFWFNAYRQPVLFLMISLPLFLIGGLFIVSGSGREKI